MGSQIKPVIGVEIQDILDVTLSAQPKEKPVRSVEGPTILLRSTKRKHPNLNRMANLVKRGKSDMCTIKMKKTSMYLS